MIRIPKMYRLKAPTLEENLLKGAAAVMGNLDSGWDVIFPGAFRRVIKGFLTDGFVAVGHNWGELPVAMPTLAKEQGNELYTEAVFHSTQAGQDARTVCAERIARSLSVGLSVGFALDWEKYHLFESGEALLNFAKDNGYDLALFDQKGLRAHKSYCRGITEIEELYEYSIVPVPMNRLARATEAKMLQRLKAYEPGQLCPYSDCQKDLAIPDEGWYRCDACDRTFYAELSDSDYEDYHCYQAERRNDAAPEDAPTARVLNDKGFDGPVTGLSLQEHSDAMVSMLRGFAQRLTVNVAARKQEGRTLSPRNKARLRETAASLRQIEAELRRLEGEAAPAREPAPDKRKAQRRERLKSQVIAARMRAQELGVTF